MNYLVVGLGNIGPEYENTRHNMGFMVLDAWAKASNAVFRTERYGDVTEINVKGRKFTLLKPSTYMNLSGKAVRYWMQELKLPRESLMVISDDLNIPFGTVRMRKNGSDGGHNGLKNINLMLGTTDYPRIRLGIGNEFSRGGQIDFVLGKLDDTQMKLMDKISERVVEGLKLWAFMGIERAMSAVNGTVRLSEEDAGAHRQENA